MIFRNLHSTLFTNDLRRKTVVCWGMRGDFVYCSAPFLRLPAAATVSERPPTLVNLSTTNSPVYFLSIDHIVLLDVS